MNKKVSRTRRAKKTRAKISRLGMPRLSVHRTIRHIYVQLIDSDGGVVKASASTAEKDFNGKFMGNVAGAKVIGGLIAERAKKAGVTKVSFDRSGFRYHGRVKALAEAAREGGLDF